MSAATEPMTPRTTASAARLATGAVVLACGVVVIWVLVGSDSVMPGPRPPPGSLFTVANWLQALMLAGAGLALLLPRPHAMHSFASGVALASAGLLFGSGVVGIKHARPHSGISGVAGFEAMQRQSIVIALVGAVAAVTALLWLVASRSFARGAERRAQIGCVVVGLLVLFVVPRLAGMGNPDDLDVKSQVAYALVWGLPWGICLALSAFVRRGTAYGLLAATAVSQVCTVTFEPMPDLVAKTPVVGGVVGLAATTVVWLILSRSTAAASYESR